MCAEYSRFFGGPEGDVPEYTQPQFAEVLEKLFSNGIFNDVDDELAVSENDPVSLSVIVASGEGWINGFWYQNTEDLVKSLGAADPDNDRIDRIILRLDTTTNFEITCEVLEGTPAADPDPPELTQTAAIYEISLAQVLVAEDATSVADEDITDEREYAAVPNTVDLASIQTITGQKTFSDDILMSGDKAIQVNVRARAYLSSDQLNLNSGVWTQILLDSESYDSGSDFASYKFTAPVNGWYFVAIGVSWKNATLVADKRYQARALKNGTDNVLSDTLHSSHTASMGNGKSDIIYLTAGDYLELEAYHDAGVNTVDVVGTEPSTHMTVHLISV